MIESQTADVPSLLHVHLNQLSLHFLPDFGAPISIIKRSVLPPTYDIAPSHSGAVGITGTPLALIGSCRLTLSIGSHPFTAIFFVYDDKSGNFPLRADGLIGRVDMANNQLSFTDNNKAMRYRSHTYPLVYMFHTPGPTHQDPVPPPLPIRSTPSPVSDIQDGYNVPVSNRFSLLSTKDTDTGATTSTAPDQPPPQAITANKSEASAMVVSALDGLVPTELQAIPKERILQEQQQDPFITKTLAKLRSAPSSTFALGQDGLLYRQSKDGHTRLVIPDSLILETFNAFHTNPYSCHNGVNHTQKLISRVVYFRNMQTRIAELVGSCQICQRTKPNHRSFTLPLAALDIPPHANFSLAIDLFGPVPTQFTDLPYGLLITDRYSQYVSVYPLACSTTDAVIQALLKHFSRYGVPHNFRLDNASYFSSEPFRTFAKIHNIDLRFSSAYRASSNCAEKSIQHFKSVCKALMQDKPHSNWTEFIDPILATLNSRMVAGSDLTAYEIHFNHPSRSIAEAQFAHCPKYSVEDAYMRMRGFHATSERVQQLLKEKHEQQKLFHDISHSAEHVDIPPGSQVFVRDDTPLKKNEQKLAKVRFTGPYMVLGQSSHNLNLRHLTTGKEISTHKARIKSPLHLRATSSTAESPDLANPTPQGHTAAADNIAHSAFPAVTVSPPAVPTYAETVLDAAPSANVPDSNQPCPPVTTAPTHARSPLQRPMTRAYAKQLATVPCITSESVTPNPNFWPTELSRISRQVSQLRRDTQRPGFLNQHRLATSETLQQLQLELDGFDFADVIPKSDRLPLRNLRKAITTEIQLLLDEIEDTAPLNYSLTVANDQVIPATLRKSIKLPPLGFTWADVRPSTPTLGTFVFSPHAGTRSYRAFFGIYQGTDNYPTHRVIIYNRSHAPVWISKGTSLGAFVPTNSNKPEDVIATLDHDNFTQTDDFDLLPNGPPTTIATLEPAPTNIDTQMQVAASGENIPQALRAPLLQLLRKYRAAFYEEGAPFPATPLIEAKVELITGSKPVCRRAYTVPLHHRDKLRAELSKLVNEGIIEESPPGPWCSPLVLVHKAKTNKLRICLDSRLLNKQTVKFTFPMATVQESLESLQHAQYFHSIDLSSAYNSVSIAPEFRDLFAFQTMDFYGRYTRVPFGFLNSYSYFGYAIQKALQLSGLSSRLRHYVDDLIIPLRSNEDPLDLLERCLKMTIDYGFKINIGKLRLFQTSIEFLGHTVHPDGYTVSDEKRFKLRQLPSPNTRSALKSALAMFSYYRGCIDNYAHLTHDLVELTKEKHPFKWTPYHERLFVALRVALDQAHTLAFPNLDADAPPFTLISDASSVAFAACLQQAGPDGIVRPIRFISKKLDDAGKRKASFRLELECVAWALKAFEPYIRHHPQATTVITDAKSILYLYTAKDLPSPLARIAVLISSFPILAIQHIPGSAMPVDYLSRLIMRNGRLEFAGACSNSAHLRFEDFHKFYTDFATKLAAEKGLRTESVRTHKKPLIHAEAEYPNFVGCLAQVPFYY